jgi:hypothetical protein
MTKLVVAFHNEGVRSLWKEKKMDKILAIVCHVLESLTNYTLFIALCSP